jgi:predicted transcriptional regulator
LNKSNRSNHEIVSDILRAIEAEELTITEIQYKTYTYQHLKKYLTYLVGHELIIYRVEENRFRITPRGLSALDMFAKLDELLIRGTLYKVIKSPECFSPFP